MWLEEGEVAAADGGSCKKNGMAKRGEGRERGGRVNVEYFGEVGSMDGMEAEKKGRWKVDARWHVMHRPGSTRTTKR